ncbi:A24 family peptidase [Neopusillimonas maritima]|nr:A24 family peptidase [Neopusillimonas maritima]
MWEWEPWGLNPAVSIAAALMWSWGLTWLLRQAALRLVVQINPRLTRQNPLLDFSAHIPVWLITTLTTLITVWLLGPTPVGLAVIVFNNVLVTLGWVDARTGLLPDLLTLPLLWLGLLVNLNGALTPLPDAVIGAIAGYLWLWITFHVFFKTTGKAGIGQGDFKLLAALGAWLGWMALPWVLLLASITALVWAGIMKMRGHLKRGQAISFGPYLAAGGIAIMLYLLA